MSHWECFMRCSMQAVHKCFVIIASSAINSLAIAKIYDNLAILSTLHSHAKIIKQLAIVIDEGCKVLIKMFTLYYLRNIQRHRLHKINYENGIINLYKLLIAMFSRRKHFKNLACTLLTFCIVL